MGDIKIKGLKKINIPIVKFWQNKALKKNNFGLRKIKIIVSVIRRFCLWLHINVYDENFYGCECLIWLKYIQWTIFKSIIICNFLNLQGGRHTDYITDQCVNKLIDVVRKKNKGGVNIKPFQVSLYIEVIYIIAFILFLEAEFIGDI